MEGSNKRSWEDLNITREEVENLKEALKKEEFRKLLTEYAEEITSPESRKQYQEEIIQLEAERGVDCTFINPEPGFVVKTSVDGKKKTFINICQNSAIGRPWSKPVIKDDSRGLSWSVPFSQAPVREDYDKKNSRCSVYDVVFHPDSLHLAGKNSQFRKLVIDTALNAIEDSYKVTLDKKNLKFPKLKYKGIAVPTVIRKRSKKQPILTEDEIEFQKNLNYPAPPPMEDKQPIVRNFDHIKEDDSKYTIPKYIIKHRTGIDLEEFTYDKNCKINCAIPKELVIEVILPLLSSTKEVALDVMERSLHLICEKPVKYKLDIQLPYAVNEEQGNAKFDQDKRILTVTLPVIKARKNIKDLLREDSGVESDFNERCDETSPIGSVESEEKLHLERISDIKSTSEIITDSSISDDGGEKHNEKEKEISPLLETEKQVVTSFLDPDKQYLLPPFKCNLDEYNICFVLNVKHVDPKSVEKKMVDLNAHHIKFLSVGAGFFPVFYSFFIKFENDCRIKDVTSDVWDNNVTLQFEVEALSSLSKYYVGVDENSLTMNELNDALQLEKKFEKMKLECKNLVDEDDDSDADETNINHDNDNKSINANSGSITVESADLNEVIIKITPEDNKGVTYKEKNKSDMTKNRKKMEPSDKRTFSESSTYEILISPVTRKSILKNRTCRSLSESNAEDYALGSSIDASEGSDLCILEENERSSSVKKTVRFNSRIRKQIYRANSSILGQKKKNQKRSRNKRKVSNRRKHESESSECEGMGREKETGKENPLIEETEAKSKENNCDIAEAVIAPEKETASGEGKNEIRFKAKKDDKIFQFKSDLIFDLDL